MNPDRILCPVHKFEPEELQFFKKSLSDFSTIPVWKQNLVPVTDYGLTLQTKDNRKEKLLLLIFYHEYRVEPRIGTSTEDVQDYKFQVTLVEVTKQYDF